MRNVRENRNIIYLRSVPYYALLLQRMPSSPLESAQENVRASLVRICTKGLHVPELYQDTEIHARLYQMQHRSLLLAIMPSSTLGHSQAIVSSEQKIKGACGKSWRVFALGADPRLEIKGQRLPFSPRNELHDEEAVS